MGSLAQHGVDGSVFTISLVVCPKCSAQFSSSFKLCGECGAKLVDAGPRSGPPADPAGASHLRDEFRDVTILFADITGFTSLSERLDPEAIHALMNDCLDGLGRIVQSNGGHIDKYIGDSIMALFGAPTAHDDDQMRAAQSAIEMQASLADFTEGRERAHRVGQRRCV